MPMNTLPLRHELKYFINERQYFVLSGILDSVLSRDPNGDEYNEYHIRSLYFDTAFNTALYDKLNGVQNRDKYRIRIYNFSDRVIKLECKTKVGTLISKRSLTIPKLLCEQLMAGDPAGLETTRSGLLNDMYREMTVNLLRPVVLVDYVREAYMHPAEEVRIFDDNVIILEVKYNHALPTYIRDLLNSYCQGALQSAISKYTWCRRYEGLGEE